VTGLGAAGGVRNPVEPNDNPAAKPSGKLPSVSSVAIRFPAPSYKAINKSSGGVAPTLVILLSMSRYKAPSTAVATLNFNHLTVSTSPGSPPDPKSKIPLGRFTYICFEAGVAGGLMGPTLTKTVG
jgi:hypothetical protein